MTEPWTLHCDGTALPNPGRIGIGAVLVAPDGQRHTLSQALGHGCNNEAEARALLLGLAEARRLGALALTVHSDSRVLVDHLNGSEPVRVAALARCFEEVRVALADFPEVSLRWLPRHRNREADALARGVLGLKVDEPPARSGPSR